MAQRKKKPKVILKKNQVIILASTIVAVCACMLTVAILTSPKAPASQSQVAAHQAPDHGTVSAETSPAVLENPSSPEAAPSSGDIGVAQVIAQLEEAERRAREAEKRATRAESAAEIASQKASEALAAQEKALEQAAAAKNSSSRDTNLAMGNKDASVQKPTTSPPSPAVKKDYTIPPASAGATLVFVLDDGGQNLADLQHYLDLPFPVAVAVLPQLSHSVESARRVRSSGRHELLLHQPMQAVNLSVNPGPGAITPAMTTTEIETLVKKNLAEIGPVAGMNNHEGSLITESKVKIGKVIEICQQQGIFFLDSRTSAATVAPQAALELGARIWERDIFLDNTQNRSDILLQIERGLAVANKKGYAIMIGHVWSGSNLAQILQELYPVLKSQGYSFSTVGGLYENFGN